MHICDKFLQTAVTVITGMWKRARKSEADWS